MASYSLRRDQRTVQRKWRTTAKRFSETTPAGGRAGGRGGLDVREEGLLYSERLGDTSLTTGLCLSVCLHSLADDFVTAALS